MPYRLVRHEWDLTEEEQEKARFILEWVGKNAIERARGESTHSLEMLGVKRFHDDFFVDVMTRLPMGKHSGCGAMAITDDSKKVAAYRVEKVT